MSPDPNPFPWKTSMLNHLNYFILCVCYHFFRRFNYLHPPPHIRYFFSLGDVNLTKEVFILQ